MPPPTPYTALSLPTVTARPSVGSLQWSGDGQLFFMTKSNVYVLTPNHLGIIASSVEKSPIDPQDSHPGALSWFRTIIDLDKSAVCNWPAISKEWGAVALGCLDIGIQALACSPSNLTSRGRCVVAVLTSNLDLSLWIASEDPFKGKWVKISEITPLLSQLASKWTPSASVRALQAQVSSITWSTHADFDMTPAMGLNTSLLVAGNRAGRLIFMRFDGKTSSCHVVSTLEVADSWLTHLTISPWTRVGAGKCKAVLAYASSSGAVGLVDILLSLKSTESSSVFGPEYAIETRLDSKSQEVWPNKKIGVTALKWVGPSDKIILVKCNPGTLDLWSETPSISGWSGYRTLDLQTLKISRDSSSLQPISGMHYIDASDVLVICLFDGSLRVVHNLSRKPSWTPRKLNVDLTSQNLSALSRDIVTKAEPGHINKRDMNRTTGLAFYDTCSTVLWTHEVFAPSNFDYKSETLHNTMLITAPLLKRTKQETGVLRELQVALTTATTAGGATPQHLLRPIFLHIQDQPNLHPQIFALLLPQSIDYSSPVFAKYSGNVTQELRHYFRESLARHLFGYDVLLQLRMRLYVAETLRRFTIDTLRITADNIAQQLVTVISQIILRIMLRHLAAVASAFNANDTPFVSRIALQCTSAPDAPSDLRTEAQALLDTLYTILPSKLSSECSAVLAMQEPCPACDGLVCLDGPSNSSCPSGHLWERCSVTSFILCTPMVRTCIGCKRKSFLPLSSGGEQISDWLPLKAQSWVVEQLLEAVNRCLFCGNDFVSVL